MELIMEDLKQITNAANLTQYFVYALSYKGLQNPITNKIYPHEFETWEDFRKIKATLKKQSSSLARKLYKEQEFKKQQIEMNFVTHNEELNA